MLIVRQLPFGFAESQASGLQCRWLGLFVSLQLAQIGAGEGDLGLQFALALIDTRLAGTHQFRSGLVRCVFGRMQGLFGRLQRVAQAALVHGDAMLRASAGEVYGRLAAVAGSHAVSAQVPFVVAQIVDNRHADARASCAYAAGQVYARVGGLHAAPLTKTLGRLLVSLARDPHPVVQCAALDALQRSSQDHSADPARFREDLMNIARTTLSSKVLSQDKDYFANLAVDAVLRLKGSTNLENIQIIKKLGGKLTDSYLDEGFILDKRIAPNSAKRLENAKILIANTSINGEAFKHRMRLLAGNHWQLRDVR